MPILIVTINQMYEGLILQISQKLQRLMESSHIVSQNKKKWMLGYLIVEEFRFAFLAKCRN
jgi:hypothetical protein